MAVQVVLALDEIISAVYFVLVSLTKLLVRVVLWWNKVQHHWETACLMGSSSITLDGAHYLLTHYLNVL